MKSMKFLKGSSCCCGCGYRVFNFFTVLAHGIARLFMAFIVIALEQRNQRSGPLEVSASQDLQTSQQDLSSDPQESRRHHGVNGLGWEHPNQIRRLL